MKKTIKLAGILGGIFCAVSACVLWAQEQLTGAQNSSPGAITIPLVRLGTMIGRDGAAFGPGLLVEVNPIRRIGFYGFAGTSSVQGYSTGDDIKANFSDRTFGVGLVCRIWKINSHVSLDAFSQAAYYGSHVRASYPDGEGGTVWYTSNDREPLVTIGPSFEFRITHTLVIFIRPGKDFGDSFAATTAGGFSLNGGVLVGIPDVVRGIRQASKFF